jgi:putative tryptophan/tyrosine transport system substrate-binding protein
LEQRRPLFAADDKSVEMGAVAGLGVAYEDVGRLGAEIVVKVARGEQSVGSIPVQTLKTGQPFVNAKAAGALNLTIPPEIRSRAKMVGQ